MGSFSQCIFSTHTDFTSLLTLHSRDDKDYIFSEFVNTKHMSCLLYTIQPQRRKRAILALPGSNLADN